MLLGSPHLANHNRDVAKTEVPDVATPERQREMAAVVDALARFRPTRIMVEQPIARQAALDARYADYRTGRYVLSQSEVDQIGLRLAARLGLDRVDAIDWNEMPPGEQADYDWLAYAQKDSAARRLTESLRTTTQASESAASEAMRCTTIASWYRAYNAPVKQASMRRIYYDYARIGDAVRQPGAAWVGNWWARNLRIMANLDRIATPADRVLLVYGAGHTALLDSFIRESGAFTLVDPLRYLPRKRPLTPCPPAR